MEENRLNKEIKEIKEIKELKLKSHQKFPFPSSHFHGFTSLISLLNTLRPRI